jgi:hypothetical protein
MLACGDQMLSFKQDELRRISLHQLYGPCHLRSVHFSHGSPQKPWQVFLLNSLNRNRNQKGPRIAVHFLLPGKINTYAELPHNQTLRLTHGASDAYAQNLKNETLGKRAFIEIKRLGFASKKF